MKTDTQIAAATPEGRIENADASAREGSGALASLVEELAWRLPGCTELEIRKTLQRVARDFCERTNCWQVVAEFPPEPDPSGIYRCPVPDGAEVVRVRENRHWIGWGDRVRGLFPRLPPPPPPDRAEGGAPEAASQSGWIGIPGPRPGFLPPPDRPVVPFLQRPMAPRPVLALAPRVGSEAVPPEIVGRHAGALASGAMAELCSMTGRPWSDPNVAAIEARKYDAAVGAATVNSISHLRPAGVPLSCRGTMPFV